MTCSEAETARVPLVGPEKIATRGDRAPVAERRSLTRAEEIDPMRTRLVKITNLVPASRSHAARLRTDAVHVALFRNDVAPASPTPRHGHSSNARRRRPTHVVDAVSAEADHLRVLQGDGEISSGDGDDDLSARLPRTRFR